MRHSNGIIQQAVGCMTRTHIESLSFEKRFESHQHTEFIDGDC